MNNQERKLKETQYRLDKMIKLNADLQRRCEVAEQELTALKVKCALLLK